MGTRRYLRETVRFATVLSTVAVATIAFAQSDSDEGGLSARLSVSTGLSYATNPDLVIDPGDAELLARAGASFRLSSVTRSQSLTFSTSGNVTVDEDGEFDFNTPGVRLRYATQSRNSRLTLSGRYDRTTLTAVRALSDPFEGETEEEDPLIALQRALGFLPPLDDDPDSDFVIVETGTRTDSNLSFRYETGLQRKVRLTLTATDRRRDYTDTTDPDLFDTHRQSIGARATFLIDPRITARLSASYSQYDADNDESTSRETVALGAGVNLKVNPLLTVDARITQRRTETTRAISEDTVVEGLTFGLSATRDLQNGEITASLTSTEGENGRRSILRFNRAMSLANGADLSFGAGATVSADGDISPLVSASYEQPFKRGQVSFQYRQELRTDEDDDSDVVLSRLAATYSRPLSPTVNWSFSASATDVNELDGSIGDSRRIGVSSNINYSINDVSGLRFGWSLSDIEETDEVGTDSQQSMGIEVAYRRALTRDWDMTAQYSYSTVADDGSDRRSGSTIGVGLSRSFDFRP